MDANATKAWTIRMPRELVQGLDRLSSEYGNASRSSLLRLAVRRFLDSHS